jgi:ribosomal protein S12 methylthiotransferase
VARSSIGQDTGFSTLQEGFDSPTGYIFLSPVMPEVINFYDFTINKLENINFSRLPSREEFDKISPKTMTIQKTRASFLNLGCFKNIVDTEVLGGFLEKEHIEIVSGYEQSDWLIINTCGFIREAKEESIEEILKALERKESGEISHLAVFGCLIQRYHRELKDQFKNIDIIWGVNDLEILAGLIARNERRPYDSKNLFLYSENHSRIITTTPNSTFIKISEGCNMPCSFCAIPQIRGPYRSRTIPSIMKEAEHLLNMGFQEINLISQNSSTYGKDLEQQSLLPRLLKEISTLGFSWIRVLYLMPEETDDDILDAFDNPSVLPYFDLPFQHVSPKILKNMKRRGGMKKNLDFINKIRKNFAGAVIRSSFIVGFPGESKEEFRELITFARESGIERIGAFGFSPEENTAAFHLKGRINPRIAAERKEQLMDISDLNLQDYNRRILNTSMEFIPLGPWENYSTIGRISSQAPEVDGFTRLKRPFQDSYKIHRIHITGFKNEFIFGEST